MSGDCCVMKLQPRVWEAARYRCTGRARAAVPTRQAELLGGGVQ